jgi:hypothetical protein
MSSSVIPTARSMARAGARWSPSVTSVLRGLRVLVLLLVVTGLPLAREDVGRRVARRGRRWTDCTCEHSVVTSDSIDGTTSGSGAGSAPAGRAPRVRTHYGPEPILLFPLSLALLGAVPLALSLPWLTWVLAVPVLLGLWVLRAGVRVEPAGLLVGNGLRRRRVRWDDVEGFDVPRLGPVRLLHAGGRTPLLALPRRDLPHLLAAAERVAGPGSARGTA